MATTTAWIKRQSNPQVVSGFATIDINETATLAIPCGGRALVRIGIPSAFTGTSLTFTVQPFPPADPASPTADPPFRQLRDAAGNIVTVTVAANRVVEVAELAGVYAFTIVSGSSEAAARAIEVQCVGPYPVSAGNNNLTIEGSTIAVTQGTSPWIISGTIDELPAAAALNATLARTASTTTIGVAPRLDDGTNVVLQASNSAANMGAATQGAAAMVSAPGQWSITHNPGANTQATITQAAGSAGQRHVITGYSAVASSGTTAPSAAAVVLTVRDGGTGAGTILQDHTIVIPASAGVSQGIARNGLNLICTAATAATIEFAAAGGANTYESVTLEGYTTA